MSASGRGALSAHASSLPQGSPGASLLNSFIRAMAPDFLSGQLRNGEALTEALIGLVVSALDTEKSAVDTCSLRDAQLLLEGRPAELERTLTERMMAAADPAAMPISGRTRAALRAS